MPVSEEKYFEMIPYMAKKDYKIEEIYSSRDDLLGKSRINSIEYYIRIDIAFSILEFYMLMGEKNTAIKLCRIFTNWGLKEAKDFCEAIDLSSSVNGFTLDRVRNKLNDDYYKTLR